MTFFEFIQLLSYGASSSRQRKSNKQTPATWISFQQNQDQMRTNTKSLLIIRCSRNMPWHCKKTDCISVCIHRWSWFTFCSDDLFTWVKKWILRFWKCRSYKNLENQKNQKGRKWSEKGAQNQKFSEKSEDVATLVRMRVWKQNEPSLALTLTSHPHTHSHFTPSSALWCASFVVLICRDPKISTNHVR